MLYQPKLLTPMGVIATVSASSLRAISMVKIILLTAVGFIAALCVSWVNFAMQLSTHYIVIFVTCFSVLLTFPHNYLVFYQFKEII